MNIFSKIVGISYTPMLCRSLKTFDFDNLNTALSKTASFLLKVNKTQVAVSWWVSPKRTRSYPYARVYDTLSFGGKKLTIIPIIKDEGKDGDRDFLQWDTISLMSLLGVYVIIGYYENASFNKRYKNKITNQKFDISYIKEKIKSILSYQSDALHWNLSQIDNAGEIAQKAFENYDKISKMLGVEVHSRSSALKRIKNIMQDKETFMNLSRKLAKKAQERETETIQPKEKLDGTKATITIENYLGGYYYFTCDEVKIKNNNIFLVEGKHTKTNNLPSEEDIKDGLIKMILFTNLKEVKMNDKSYSPIPALKLTTENNFVIEKLSNAQRKLLLQLKKEAEINNFKIIINDNFIN